MVIETQDSHQNNHDEIDSIRSCSGTEQKAGELISIVFEGILGNPICEFNMRQMAIFLRVSRKSGCYVTDISNALNLPMSSISRSVDVLEARGVVRRKRIGKYVQVHMTPKGKALVGQAISTINNMM